jgi:hypothetical protein
LLDRPRLGRGYDNLNLSKVAPRAGLGIQYTLYY